MSGKTFNERIKEFWTAHWVLDYLFIKYYKLIGETKRTYKFDVKGEQYKLVTKNEDVIGIEFDSTIDRKISISKSKIYTYEMFDTREEAINNLIERMDYELERCKWRMRNYPILKKELLRISNNTLRGGVVDGK